MTHIERIQQEKLEVDQRLAKLDLFLSTNSTVDLLDSVSIMLMYTQRDIMSAYSGILQTRLNHDLA